MPAAIRNRPDGAFRKIWNAGRRGDGAVRKI